MRAISRNRWLPWLLALILLLVCIFWMFQFSGAQQNLSQAKSVSSTQVAQLEALNANLNNLSLTATAQSDQIASLESQKSELLVRISLCPDAKSTSFDLTSFESVHLGLLRYVQDEYAYVNPLHINTAINPRYVNYPPFETTIIEFPIQESSLLFAVTLPNEDSPDGVIYNVTYQCFLRMPGQGADWLFQP